jgi:two-component system invasion response regulator UvrY
MTLTNDIPVLIVDDQAAFRSAARTVTMIATGFTVSAEAESGERAVELVEGGAFDSGIVLMDINLGGITGIEATKLITRGRPDLVVILMSTYTVEDLPSDAGDCGAAAYVHKEDLGPDVLSEAWRNHLAADPS